MRLVERPAGGRPERSGPTGCGGVEMVPRARVREECRGEESSGEMAKIAP